MCRSGGNALVFFLVVLFWLAWTVPAEAQLGVLVSPGELSTAHAALEGLRNCEKCHERGRRITASKCLACHAPIAERIAMKKGVHRAVTTDCVACHVEHAGRDGELRPFDTRTFDHARQTGFALTGRHGLGANCAACHKTRSFLGLTSTCTACHRDVHKGSLGRDCGRCHDIAHTFRETRTSFDHSKTGFPLTGAHRSVMCATCHPAQQYRAANVASCAGCHKSPHRQTIGPACARCHSSDTWQTRTIDHSKTAFPLTGLHGKVECSACHVQRPMKTRLSFDRCAACHSDPHKGAFPQDCKACHSESGFRKAPFDHTRTKFPLTDRHAALACATCHKPVASSGTPLARRVVDFRGLTSACVSCHQDVHQNELGAACETCHSSKTFAVPTFTHPRFRELFEGAHAALRCNQCHESQSQPRRPPSRTTQTALKVTFKGVRTDCVACHKDVHLGQVGTACQTCHSVHGARFALVGFSHDRARFRLRGLHQPVQCVTCHKQETAHFPAGSGTARRLTGISTGCAACHIDAHAGQLGNTCETCHTDSAKGFRIVVYTHQSRTLNREFFVGPHLGLACAACHGPAGSTKQVVASSALRYRIGSECVSCHVDIHKGALGPRCGTCHRLR
jgi:hypothetical protein